MQKSHYILIGIIGVLALILFFDGCSEEPERKYDNIYNTYTTDTTHFNKAYKTLLSQVEDLEDKLEKTPPKEVRYYPTPNPETTTVEKIPDSILIYIGELEERLAISDKYLKNYPSADKLIDFRLSRDLFDITTLNTDGETKGSETPLYLDEYNYYWDNNTLYHERREEPYQYPKENVWNQLYLQPGYDFFQSAPELGLEYSLDINRFRISTEASTLFHDTGAQIYGKVKLGYRLLK